MTTITNTEKCNDMKENFFIVQEIQDFASSTNFVREVKNKLPILKQIV